MCIESVKRCYAATGEAPAVKDKLTVTVASPYQTYLKDAGVDQVNLNTTTGSLGILHKHVPTIQQLQPGLIEIIGGEQPTKIFGNYQILILFSAI